MCHQLFTGCLGSPWVKPQCQIPGVPTYLISSLKQEEGKMCCSELASQCAQINFTMEYIFQHQTSNKIVGMIPTSAQCREIMYSVQP